MRPSKRLGLACECGLVSEHNAASGLPVDSGNPIMCDKQQTVADQWSVHRTQVRSLDIDREEERVVVGYANPVLELFKVASEEEEDPGTSGRKVLISIGDVQRTTTDRATQVSISPDGLLVACLGSGKAIEIYR